MPSVPDRVAAFADASIGPDEARATLAVAELERLCRGHFPGDPIVPGAYVAGLMAELGVRLLEARGERRRLARLERCAFHAPLRPVGNVTMRAVVHDGDPGAVEVEVRHAGRVVARGRMRFA